MRKLISLVIFCFSLDVYANSVLIGGDENTDACSGYGVVKTKTQIYKAPVSTKKPLSKLPVGAELYICQTSKNGKWFGVVVKNAKDSCGVTSPQKSKSPYQGNCKSGWVPTSAVEYLAG